MKSREYLWLQFGMLGGFALCFGGYALIQVLY